MNWFKEHRAPIEFVLLVIAWPIGTCLLWAIFTFSSGVYFPNAWDWLMSAIDKRHEVSAATYATLSVVGLVAWLWRCGRG